MKSLVRARVLLSAATTATGIVAALTLAACSSDDASGGSPMSGGTQMPPSGGNGGNTGGSTPAAGKLSIRIVHASPDAPKVDVWAAGVSAPLVTGLGYGDTTPYLSLDAGSYEIQLRASPSKASDPIAYTTGKIDLPANAKITAVAAGLLGSMDDASKFRVLPLAEGFAAPGSGKAAVRVVHASADAPTVGVDVGDDDPTKPEIASLARFADTGAEGVALPSGQALQIGIDAGGARVTGFTTPKLPDGGDLFVIATGLVGKLPREQAGFSLLAVGPSGTIGFVAQNPTVYALHASPDAPAVDLFAGSAQLADDLAFGAVSAPIQVPPGAYTLDFFAHAAGAQRPAGNPAATAQTPALEAGQRYLAVATGFLAGSPAFQLQAYQEGFALDDAAHARLRVVHASPDAPAVDIGVLAGGKIAPVLVPSLAFAAATDAAGLSVPPASLTLGVTPAGQPSTIAASFDVTTTAQSRAFVVAAGALGANATNKQQPFRLLVVDTSARAWAVAPIAPKS